MISITKKLLSVALAVVLLLGAFPATVLAAEAEIPDAPAAADAGAEVAKEWTVHFYPSKEDGLNGTNEIKHINVADGKSVPGKKFPKVPAAPEGYQATGNWKYVRLGDVYAGQAIVDETNLYPEYAVKPEAKKFTVSFNVNCTDLMNPDPITVKENGTYHDLMKLKREGYSGVWTYGSTKVHNGDALAVQGDHVLVADWTPIVYDVTFHYDHGGEMKTVQVAHGQKIKNAPSYKSAITEPGTRATGWDYDLTQPVTSDLDIYVKEVANTYTITFDPYDSKVPGTENLTKKYKEVTYGKKIGAMKEYGVTDYVLVGWERDGVEYTANTIYDIEEDITLHAIWERQAIVEIHIYRNGKTASAYGEPVVFNLPVGATLQLKNVDIRDYYNGSSNFKFEGYYDAVGWRAYKAGENPKPIEQVKTIHPKDGIVELYCMVTDNDAVAPTTKPTTKPADPNNPQTGDESMILATTTAMLISAGALMLIVYDRKRRNA